MVAPSEPAQPGEEKPAGLAPNREDALAPRHREAAAGDDDPVPLLRRAESRCVQLRRGQRIALVAADRAELARLPRGSRANDLLWRARHEVPPHEQPLPERLAAEQHERAARWRG